MQLIAAVLLEQLGQPRTATAATDQTELDFAVVFDRLSWRFFSGLAAGLDERADSAGGKGGAEKLAAGKLDGGVHGIDGSGLG